MVKYMPAKNMGKVMNSQRPFMAGRTSLSFPRFYHLFALIFKRFNTSTIQSVMTVCFTQHFNLV